MPSVEVRPFRRGDRQQLLSLEPGTLPRFELFIYVTDPDRNPVALAAQPG
jgi:hypothetical protein